MFHAKGFNDCFKFIPLSTKFLFTILLLALPRNNGCSKFLFPLGYLIYVSPLASYWGDWLTINRGVEPHCAARA